VSVRSPADVGIGPVSNSVTVPVVSGRDVVRSSVAKAGDYTSRRSECVVMS
jgi:hypothetical protein